MHSLLRRIDQWLAPHAAWQVLSLGTLLVGLIGAMDLATGFELSFSIFYLVPISISAWYAGKRGGVAICVLSAAVWFAVDQVSGDRYTLPFYPYWNAAVRLGLFVIVSLLLDALQQALTAQRELASVDGLTGLHNARSFRARAQRMLETAADRDAPVVLAYLDLDGFKGINDRRGHDAGDEILRAIGACLSQGAARGDLLGRLGGDEFAILRVDCAAQTAQSGFADLHRDLTQLATERGWPIGYSIGVAAFDRAPLSVDEVIKRADQVMYAVKKDGRNRVQVETQTDRENDD